MYTKNNERGIYKTSDGGKTWKQTLFVNDETGVIDVIVDASNFNIQYVSAWHKDRKAWNFNGNGLGSGIYKSIDAGETWKLVTQPNSGFPTGEKVGRIGLALVQSEIIYADALQQVQLLRRISKVNQSSKKSRQSVPS